MIIEILFGKKWVEERQVEHENSNFANLLFLGIHKFLSKMLILFMVLIDQIRNKVEVAGNQEITLRYPTNF